MMKIRIFELNDFTEHSINYFFYTLIIVIETTVNH